MISLHILGVKGIGVRGGKVLMIILTFFFLAALGLHCCVWAFSSCGEWGLLFVVVRGFLLAVASLVVEHGL